ncbi:MAG TPA: hypothetical protein VFV32_10680 [Acidimicrobiales bacterium]|nr:hypothetical protein [Acidimicrobiales bacterium]
MSMRRVTVRVHGEEAAGVLITDDGPGPRSWFVQAASTSAVLIDLGGAGPVTVVLEHDAGASKGVGCVRELTDEPPSLRIEGSGPLEPWPE